MVIHTRRHKFTMTRAVVSLALCCFGMVLNSHYTKQVAVLKDSMVEPLCGILPSFPSVPSPTFDKDDDVDSLDDARDLAADTEDHVPDDDSFSACLLVMDDNHRLVEWIAYHFYALNLRYLIVADDPSSTEDPSVVLDRWKDKIKIELWTDTTFLEPEELAGVQGLGNNATSGASSKQQAVAFHRTRQRMFYKRCAARLKDQRRKWTGFFDDDEYVTLNSHVVNNTDALVAQPNHLYKFLKELHQKAQPLNDTSLLGYHFRKPCIILPRINYGHTESSDEEIEKDVPRYLDPSRFDTLRWMHRSAKDKDAILGKGIVDVSKLTRSDLDLQAFGNAHRPFSLCKDSNAYVHYNLPLGLHHYLGSWEQYNYREKDARQGSHMRDAEKWVTRGGKSYSVLDETRPWIQGFSRMFGDDNKAVMRMLDGAGLPSKRSRPDKLA